jgi:diaminopimelate decarboxylase
VQALPDPTPADLIAARPNLAMHARDGLLLDGVPLAPIAAACGTPCWVTAAATLRARTRALAAALAPTGARIHYAVKANDHLAILSLLARAGAGADVVSGGELARARAAGIPPDRIVFSGVGKTRAEIGQALAAGIAQINVESAEELAAISAIAAAANRRAPIALRINPDVDAGTHDKISTGRAGDKFGIPLDQAASLYRQAHADPALDPLGLALHIGSQIASTAPFHAAYRRAAGLIASLRADGLPVRRLDCGGGLGIAYRAEPAASPSAFAGVLATTLGGLGLELIVEPGRWLAGPAGVLLAAVVRVKHAQPHPFVVLDAAMNDLARPALYDSWHGIVPLSPLLLHAPLAACDVVGPVCESTDVLARGRPLPRLAEHDTVAILDAGAYGAVMSSTYNARPLAPQVLIDGPSWHVIRPRQTFEDLWRGETVPA